MCEFLTPVHWLHKRYSWMGGNLLTLSINVCRLFVVWPTTSCFADWSKRRHVTFIIIDWPTRFKLSLMVFKCLHGRAPDYLSELCMPVAQVAERQHLRSASRHLLVVPRFQLHTYGRRAFAVAGPTTWNSLSVELRDPDLGVAAFGRSLKTFLFRRYSVHWAH